MLRVKSDFSGLERLKRNVERIAKTNQVSFAELFSPAFMRKYTSYPTMEVFIDASGYQVDSMDDFAAIPDADWDEHVRASSRFRSWEEMIGKAGEEWASAQMNRR